MSDLLDNCIIGFPLGRVHHQTHSSVFPSSSKTLLNKVDSTYCSSSETNLNPTSSFLPIISCSSHQFLLSLTLRENLSIHTVLSGAAIRLVKRHKNNPLNICVKLEEHFSTKSSDMFGIPLFCNALCLFKVVHFLKFKWSTSSWSFDRPHSLLFLSRVVLVPPHFRQSHCFRLIPFG